MTREIRGEHAKNVLGVVLDWADVEEKTLVTSIIGGLCGELWRRYKSTTKSINFFDTNDREAHRRFLESVPMADYLNGPAETMTAWQAEDLMRFCPRFSMTDAIIPWEAARVLAKCLDYMAVSFADGVRNLRCDPVEGSICSRLSAYFENVSNDTLCYDNVGRALASLGTVMTLTIDTNAIGRLLEAVPETVTKLTLRNSTDDWTVFSTRRLPGVKTFTLEGSSQLAPRDSVPMLSLEVLMGVFPEVETVEFRNLECVFLTPPPSLRSLSCQKMPMGDLSMVETLSVSITDDPYDIMCVRDGAPNVRDLKVKAPRDICIPMSLIELYFPRLERVDWDGFLYIDNDRDIGVVVRRMGVLSPRSRCKSLVIHGINGTLVTPSGNENLRHLETDHCLCPSVLQNCANLKTLRVNYPLNMKECLEEICKTRYPSIALDPRDCNIHASMLEVDLLEDGFSATIKRDFFNSSEEDIVMTRVVSL